MVKLLFCAFSFERKKRLEDNQTKKIRFSNLVLLAVILGGIFSPPASVIHANTLSAGEVSESTNANLPDGVNGEVDPFVTPEVVTSEEGEATADAPKEELPSDPLPGSEVTSSAISSESSNDGAQETQEVGGNISERFNTLEKVYRGFDSGLSTGVAYQVYQGTLYLLTGLRTGVISNMHPDLTSAMDGYDATIHNLNFEGNKTEVKKIVFEDSAKTQFSGFITHASKIKANVNMSAFFSQFSNLESVEGLELLDVSSTTNMTGMFTNLSKLTSITGLESWDTGKVTTMSSMFNGASSLTSVDVSKWNTSNVTTMNNMFSGANSLTTLNVSNWDTSNVMNMSYMFHNATSLTSVDVSKWNTSKVTDMRNLFAGLNSLTTLNVSNWDTSNVTNMYSMFSGVNSSTTLDVSKWNTSNVTSMSNMFSGASKLTRLDISNWDMGQVTNKMLMFYGMTSLKELKLGPKTQIDDTDLSAVPSNETYSGKWQNVGSGTVDAPKGSNIWTSEEFMANYDGTQHADTYVWQTKALIFGSVTYDYDATSAVLTLTGGTVSNASDWASVTKADVKKIAFSGDVGVAPNTSLSNMFANMTNLTTIENAGRLNTSNATSMGSMFYYVSKLTSVDVSSWNTSKVTDMSNMFTGASSLTSLDVSKWDVSKVTTFSRMFQSTGALKNLDVSQWNTSSATNMESVFYYSSGLGKLDMSNWDMGQVTNKATMFSGMTSLKELKLGAKTNISGTSLPGVPSNEIYTGKWQNVGSGTVDAPKGTNIWTSTELMANYDGTQHADTYVWQAKALIFGGVSYDYDATSGVLTLTGGTVSNASDWASVTKADVKKIVFSGDVSVAPNTSLSNMFANMTNLATIENAGRLDTSNATNMGSMFYGVSSLTSVDVSKWNTSNVTNMSNMFRGASSLTSVDVSKWNTSNVTTVSYMFYNASKLARLDLSNWDMSKVTSKTQTLSGLTSLKELKLGSKTQIDSTSLPAIPSNETYSGKWQNVGSGTVDAPKGSNIWTSEEFMANYDGTQHADTYVWQSKALIFGGVTYDYDATSGVLILTDGTVSNASDWASVTKADVKKIAFSGDVSVAPNTSLSNMFANMTNLTTIEDAGRLDISSATNMGSMFYGVSSLTSVDVSKWNTSNVTDMSNMFRGASSLTSVDVSKWNTSNVTTVSYMFYNASKLIRLDMSNWDMSKVTFKTQTLSGLTSLKELKLGSKTQIDSTSLPAVPSNETYSGKWQNVGSGTVDAPKGSNIWTSEEFMANYDGTQHADTYVWQSKALIFGGVSYDYNATSAVLTLTGGTVSNASDWASVTKADVKKIVFSGDVDVAPNTSLQDLFASMTNLTVIENADKLNTSNATNMRGIFYEDLNLASVDVSSWDTSDVTDMRYMFQGAIKLTHLDLSFWDMSKVTTRTDMLKGLTALKELKLGSKTQIDSTSLPAVPSNETYSGKWQNVGSGTVDAPKGSNIWTSSEFMTNYDGTQHADTYVWQSKALIFGDVTYNYDAASAILTLTGGTVSNASDWASVTKVDVKKIVFSGDVDVAPNTSLENMFYNLSNLTVIENANKLDTSNATSMFYMFSGTSQLTSVDVSSWDTSNVTSMAAMFRDASQLTSIDVSAWDTSNVGVTSHMFQGASSLESLDLSHWDMSKTTDFYRTQMLSGLTSLKELRLGAKTQVAGTGLSDVPSDMSYTGKWQNVGSGTVAAPQGSNIWTSSEFMANYDGAQHADTYVWQSTYADLIDVEVPDEMIFGQVNGNDALESKDTYLIKNYASNSGVEISLSDFNVDYANTETSGNSESVLKDAFKIFSLRSHQYSESAADDTVNLLELQSGASPVKLTLLGPDIGGGAVPSSTSLSLEGEINSSLLPKRQKVQYNLNMNFSAVP
ncbi:BspA family leucine-rich repeat surface protein [Enterococcus hirae]|nr:BspA family leucine-rich repeat surface protein [Enterococcus hirae]